jgi:Zn-dependent protease/predicted transcriptional regulator
VFGLPSLRIGRFFGIPVELNLSWVLIFLLIAGTLSFGYFPSIPAFRQLPIAASIAAGVITAILFFASVLLHELSHSLVARALGIKIERVTLFLFGGVAQMSEEPSTPRDEFAMAIAGPGMSILLAAVSFALWILLYLAGVSPALWEPLKYLSFINLALGIINLLPGFPLDGGRVLRALLWWASKDLLKATRWATWAGQFWGWSFVVVGILGFLGVLPAYSPFDFLWIGVIGWFLVVLAGASWRQQLMQSRLTRVTVDSIASRPAVVVPGDATVDEIVVEHIIGGRHSKYPVATGGRLVGILSLNHAKAVRREDWGATTAAQLAEGDLGIIVIAYDATIEDALQRLAPDHPGMLVVDRNGMLDGVVTRHDVLAELRRRASEPPA